MRRETLLERSHRVILWAECSLLTALHPQRTREVGKVGHENTTEHRDVAAVQKDGSGRRPHTRVLPSPLDIYSGFTLYPVPAREGVGVVRILWGRERIRGEIIKAVLHVTRKGKHKL